MMGACVARSSRPDQQQQQHQQQQQPLPSNIMDMPMPMPSSGAALVVHVPPPSFTLAMPFAPSAVNLPPAPQPPLGPSLVDFFPAAARPPPNFLGVGVGMGRERGLGTGAGSAQGGLGAGMGVGPDCDACSVPALMLLLPPTDYPLQQPLSAVESARDSAATSAVATSAVATSIGAAAATAPAAAAAAAAVELVSPRPESVGGRSRSSGAGGGEFQLAGHPMLVLRVLSECHLEPEDLARLEATSSFFKRPANFPPDSSLSLPEVAAFDMCQHRKSFLSMRAAAQSTLKARCGGTWKSVLHFLLMGERSTRRGQRHVAAGCAHSIAVGEGGEVFTFGNGSSGQLGHGVSECEWRPRIARSLAGVRIVQAAAGRSRSMLVSEGGQVFHCGRDCYGDQDYSAGSPRMLHTPTLVESLHDVFVVQVTLGSFFTAVLDREGRVHTFSWGAGERLCHATDAADTQPQLLGGALEGRAVAQIAGGHCFLLALAYGPAPGARSVWSLGCGLGGKLGHGERCDEKLPRQIAHFDALGFSPVAIAAGAWHSAAVAADGRVATWGWGRHGCLGHDGDMHECLPRVVEGLAQQGARVVHVAAGDYTTFAVGAGGEVWSFGSADSACLGHAPAGILHGAAAAAGGGAGGGLGGLGGGGAADEVVVGADEESFQKDVFKPRLVAALAGGQLAADRVVQISPSNTGHYEAHMLALTQSGRVLACGAGGKGQLGVELGGAHERPLLETVEGLSL